MRIAVIGATGRLGAPVAQALSARGHDVRMLSRGALEHRIDLRTGEGLASALSGCQVVIDASNDNSRRAAEVLAEGTRRLLDAEVAAGVRHHVCVSVVGCDRAPLHYYRLKVDQERVVSQAPIGWSIVRATQFHELIDGVLSFAARARVLPIPVARLQPIASSEVAAAVTDVAQGPPLRGRLEVAGPEILDARELARLWAAAKGRRTLLLQIPLPGRLGLALRSGALTTDSPDVRGATAFASWLTARPAR